MRMGGIRVPVLESGPHAQEAMSKRVCLIHWNASEVQERAQRLTRLGYDVVCESRGGPEFLRALRRDPPLAVVIDLSRLPSQGRDAGVALRQTQAARNVPLVFVGGGPEKVTRIRELLPDAVFTSWEHIGSAVQHAVAQPPDQPAAPESVFAAYAGRPLVQKLGIKPGSCVALVGAPRGFQQTLGQLPEGAVLCKQGRRPCDVTLWFVRSRDELQRGMERMVGEIRHGALWIAWPKKTTPLAADVSQPDVRAAGLAAGLVDYKICSIDATWSGLLFTRRRPARPGGAAQT